MGRIPVVKPEFWDASLLPQGAEKPDTAGMKRVAALPQDAGPLARELHRRMVEKDMGQKALALAAGVNETYVRDILRGKSLNPKQAQLDKVAKALGCSVQDLISPGRPQQLQDNERTAQTDEELALLRIWRRASDIGRDRIMRSIEGALVGELLGAGKAKDI